MDYKPWRAEAVDWQEIENRYTRNWEGKHIKMLELIRHIRNTSLINRLYGSTSMDKLVVSIYDPLDYRNESLHITFDLNSNKWLFEYWAKPSSGLEHNKPEYTRVYDALFGIDKFDDFIRMMKW